jgi:hypothetical protein
MVHQNYYILSVISTVNTIYIEISDTMLHIKIVYRDKVWEIYDSNNKYQKM